MRTTYTRVFKVIYDIFVMIGEGWKQKDEGIMWFRYVFPRTQDKSWPAEYKPVSRLKAST
jgi:hypothetical protein